MNNNLRGFTIDNWNTYFYIKNHTETEPCDFFLKEISKHNHLTNLKCLDIGCGIGLESKYMIDNKWNVDAIDPIVPKEYLTNNINSSSFHFIQGDICDPNILNMLDTNYDIIIAFSSMPYFSGKIDAIKSTIDQIYQRLKVGGVFIGSFLGDKHDWVGKRDAVFLSMEEVLDMFNQFQINSIFTLYKKYEYAIEPYNYELHYVSVTKIK